MRRFVKDIFGNWTAVPTPAMEAGEGATPDLTRETQTMMRNTVRRSGQNPNTTEDLTGADVEPKTTSEETRQEDGTVGDGINTDPDMVPDGTGEEGADDDLGLNDDEGGADEGLDEGDGVSNGTDDAMNPDGTPTESKSAAISNANLQANMSALLGSVSNLLKVLNDNPPAAMTDDVRSLYMDAITHLNEIEKILMDELLAPFTEENYPHKMRKFVTIRHIYSATIDQLQMHLQILEIENGTGKPGRGEKAH